MMTRRAMIAGLAAIPLVAGTRGAKAAPTMKIGIIGSGQVGSTLGGLWVKAGYRVMFSAMEIDDAQSVATGFGQLASAGTSAQAAGFGDVVLLAVPYRAVPVLGQQLNGVLSETVLLDATNPFEGRDGEIAQTAGRDGAGPTTQRYFPAARVVRGFNSVAMSTIRAQAHREPPRLAIPIASDHPEALRPVEELVLAAGFDPVVTGGLDTAIRFQPGHPGFLMERDAKALKAALSGKS